MIGLPVSTSSQPFAAPREERLLDSLVLPPQCGVIMTFSMRKEGTCRVSRLRLRGVETRAGDLSGAQRLDQRRLIDQTAAGGVDQAGGLFHAREFTLADPCLFSAVAAMCRVIKSALSKISSRSDTKAT